jgi:hypothetical protein
MVPARSESIHFFREVPQDPSGIMLGDATSNDAAEESFEERNGILCRQCRQVISSSSERIAVEGTHRHTFANPHGFIFHIGCFRSANGCSTIGPLTDEFTWFIGFQWRIAVCSMCLTHLGWLFVARRGESFNGLILDRLIEP